MSSSKSADAESLSVAFGCLLGAFVGDSAGSLLEFQNAPSPADVDRAMEMPGGGVHCVLPGQLTDDGELTLCLAHALLETNRVADDAPFNGFPASAVARWYGQWIRSKPFDAGNTCRTAMNSAYDATAADDATHKYAHACMRTAFKHSYGSMANGSLMRCTPVAIAYHRSEDDVIAAHAMTEAKLSHPNLTCCICDALYCIAIAHLIRTPHDRSGACQRVEEYWTKMKTSLFAEIDQETETAVSSHEKKLLDSKKECINEVNNWLYIAKTGRGLSPTAYEQQGYIRHAFIYAFYHLYHNTDYATALKYVLLAGGDTDTNACITGGLIGAAVGVNGIPAEMRRKVMECKSDHDFEPEKISHHRLSTIRPDWLWPNQVEDIATKLYYRFAPHKTAQSDT